MRQTNRFFFCGHTSGKVSGQAPFLPPGALSFTQFWCCSWGAGRSELSSYSAMLYYEIIFEPDIFWDKWGILEAKG